MRVFAACLLLLSLTSCTMTPELKAKWGATGSLVARKAAGIAGSIILNGAIAELSGKDVNWLDSAAAGVRTLPATVSSDDIEDLVKIWTPAAKPGDRWSKLGNELGKLAETEIQKGTPPPVVAEKIAVGLNDAAASARKP